jgi:[ribosomal protein S5]-alanine N-acetyltransferase
MEKFMAVEIPTLQGNNLILRAYKPEDAEDRFRAGRQAEIVHMFGGDTRNMKPYTREEAKLYFEQPVLPYNAIRWVMEFEGKCIGGAKLTLFEADRKARFAIGIFDISKLGKGLGTEATNLVLGYAFITLGLHRVELRVLEYNKRAIACYQKCDFTIEGIERDSALVEDKWESDVMMSILETEYRALHNQKSG